MTPRRRLVLLAVAAGLAGSFAPRPSAAQVPALPTSHPTPAERAGYLAFTDRGEVGPFLAELATDAEGVSVDSLVAGAVSLPIVRLAPTGTRDDEERPVVRVLVLGSQHGTERAGLEVGLQTARDLAVGRLAGLRAGLDVRIVPVANPAGVRDGRAAMPGGVDPERDHVRLSADETRALWSEYAAFRPHLVLDLHEIGPSEYPVQIAVPTHPAAPVAGRFARFYLLPFAANRLARADIPFHEYVTQWQEGVAVEGAAEPEPDGGAGTWYTPPPLDASSARNAFGLAGSVSFFVAVASSRDIAGLERRVEGMRLAVGGLLTAAAGLAPDLVRAHLVARELPKSALALRARYVAETPDASTPWIFINEHGQREQGQLAPWRSEIEVEAELEAPAGWWISPEADDLAAALRDHGFEVREGTDAPTSPLLAYPRCLPTGDADAVRDALREHAEPLPAGAAWVPADQPGGRLLFTIVEPWSRWGWFGADAGDGAEDAAGNGAEDAGEPGDRGAASDCETDSLYPVYRVAR